MAAVQKYDTIMDWLEEIPSVEIAGLCDDAYCPNCGRGCDMTNREKFKEVYGFELEGSPCVAPEKICDHYGECGRCPFQGWWEKEYLPCFRMKEDLSDEE